MDYKSELKIFLLISLISCSLPNSKLASVSINATVVDATGKVIPNKRMEITLPASYGMREIDMEYSEPEEIEKREQTVIVQTDLTGTFSHTFESVSYNTAYWWLPPLGNFPKEPPRPSFVIRMTSDNLKSMGQDQNAVYSVGWNENDELNYAVVRDQRTIRSKPPFIITGKILRQERGEVPACIADFNFKKSK